MKLKAATMIESLIAMIILVTCIGTGTMIYMNVLGSDEQRVQLKAALILKDEAARFKSAGQFINYEKEIEKMNLSVNIEKYQDSEELYQLEVTLREGEKVIGVHRELILQNP